MKRKGCLMAGRLLLTLFICFNSVYVWADTEINVEKAKNVLNEKYNISLSLTVLYKIYRAFRELISKYLSIVYQTEELGHEEEYGIFAVDESLFNHVNILGIINTSSKIFRSLGTYLKKIHRDLCKRRQFNRF